MPIYRKFWYNFFSQSYALFELRNLAKMKNTTVFVFVLAKMKDTTQQFVSATPLKPLNRIFWSFVVMKDIMCRCAYPQEILIPFFFLGFTPFLNLEIWPKWKILLKQLVSTTPLKLLNRIAWNFVVMKDIMCRYAFIQEMLIWSFWGAIYIPFFVRLPVPNAWNCHSLYTAFSSNVGAWGMWACSLFLSFSLC